VIRAVLAGLVLGTLAWWWWASRDMARWVGHISVAPTHDDEPLPPYDPHIGELVRWN